MYKAAVRTLVRHSISRLNAGDPTLLLRLASADAELAFPGENTWAAMHRPVVKSRRRHVTHRGIDECRTFAERFVNEGIQFEIEDILVNGPPWNLRIALRVNDVDYPMRAGDCAVYSAAYAHTFRNDSARPASTVGVTTARML